MRAQVLVLAASLGCSGTSDVTDAALDGSAADDAGVDAADIGVLVDGGDAALCPRFRPAPYSPCPHPGLYCEIVCRPGMDDVSAFKALCTKVGWSSTGNCAKDGGR